MAATVKLVMALVWLLVGGGIFYWQWAHPDRPGLTIWTTDISIGWAAILLSVYNLLFGLMAFYKQKRQRAVAQAEAQRQKKMRKRSHAPQEPNSAFDFTDKASSKEPRAS
jgi:hypothetical protein